MLISPLATAQRECGGVPADPATPLPRTYHFCNPAVLHFGDAAAEYRAARDSAALFDISDRAQIEVSGRDARKFLNGFCTNDVTRLQAGQGCEAFVTNVKGRILAHIFVFAGQESFCIETSGHVQQPLLDHFNRYLITDDVQLHARTDMFGQLLITGPRCLEKLQSAEFAAGD